MMPQIHFTKYSFWSNILVIRNFDPRHRNRAKIKNPDASILVKHSLKNDHFDFQNAKVMTSKLIIKRQWHWHRGTSTVALAPWHWHRVVHTHIKLMLLVLERKHE